MIKQPTPHLKLHTLLIALSYWGTATRMMLTTFLLAVAVAATVTSGGGGLAHAAQFGYVVGSLLLLDAGYVTIARALPFRYEGVDQALFVILFAALAAVVFLPYFVLVSGGVVLMVKWLFLVVLFILGLRLLLALAFGHSKK